MAYLRHLAPLAHSVIDKLVPNWRHPDPNIRLAAVGRIKREASLRKIAATSKDDHILLLVGLKLKDHKLLQRLARLATDEQIRLSSAMAVGDQNLICRLVLECWDIELGKSGIKHISRPGLLKKIARLAAQDHIRLEAARKLGDREAMRKIALNSFDLELRWSVANQLKDYILLAELANCLPSSSESRVWQRKALHALNCHLEQLASRGMVEELLKFITKVRFYTLKAAAFCKIPPSLLGQRVLLAMSRQNMQYMEPDLLDNIFEHIRSACWQVKTRFTHQVCPHCRGSAPEPPDWRSPPAPKSHPDNYPCPDCGGIGSLAIRVTVCQRNNRIVVFKIPQTT